MITAILSARWASEDAIDLTVNSTVGDGMPYTVSRDQPDPALAPELQGEGTLFERAAAGEWGEPDPVPVVVPSAPELRFYADGKLAESLSKPVTAALEIGSVTVAPHELIDFLIVRERVKPSGAKADWHQIRSVVELNRSTAGAVFTAIAEHREAARAAWRTANDGITSMTIKTFAEIDAAGWP